MAKTVNKAVVPPATKGERNNELGPNASQQSGHDPVIPKDGDGSVPAMTEETTGVTALPGDGNPVLPMDEDGIIPTDADENVGVITSETQTVTALPGDGNPLLANPDADDEPDPEKAKRASRGKTTIILDGEGTSPIYGNGAMRRVDRGEPIKVTAAELAFIKKSGAAYTATEAGTDE